MSTLIQLQVPHPTAKPRQLSPAAERIVQRIILTVAVAIVSTILALEGQASVLTNTDFTQLWHAARGLVEGRNPYDVVGPGKAFPWPFPLLYPGPAVLVSVPFSVMPLRWACALFVGLSAATLAWGLSEERGAPYRWFVFASAGAASVVRTAQWAPLMMATALLPSMGWALACKPSIGTALFMAYPSWRKFWMSAALACGSLLLMPRWPLDWLAALPSAYHMTAPISHVTAGGPLILLALLRWRRPEARLLVALGCIPHTTMVYETLPLFLVPKRWSEAGWLVVASWIVLSRDRQMDYLQLMHMRAWWITLLMYIPCVVMVLRRGAESEPDATP
ncbi:hypothetical protein LuPra_05550 [Luteitalea pratensis]|uniref:DUF2029 domain-containing protein n=1 Tax=Luteitalea pratensis TaxID=1855912 RepID=A0A143PU80_LUTPR|nr:hypothetical protein [Luteitalea pratensis]AMY12277.1 hypothetical protein LuPra_05550 [Luteitalea pratensis]